MNYNNLAQNTNFIASSPQFKNIPFYVVSTTLPGWQISHSEAGGRGGARIQVGGNIISFNPVSLEILVDEDMIIYNEIMSIMESNVNINDGTFNDFYFDMYIECTNAHGNKIIKFDFFNCRLLEITDLVYDSQRQTDSLVVYVDFVYDYYTREIVRKAPESYQTPRIITSSYDRGKTEEEKKLKKIINLDFTKDKYDAELIYWGDPRSFVKTI